MAERREDDLIKLYQSKHPSGHVSHLVIAW